MSTELAVLMPVMVLFAFLAVFIVQVGRHDSRTQQAADAAARAASLAQDPENAQAVALSAAQAVCYGPVAIQPGDFVFTPADRGTFTPGRVAVRVTCTESFRGYGRLGGDSTRTEAAVAVAVVEYWRGTP